MQLKQLIYEDEKVLNSSSRAGFYSAVRAALLPLLEVRERERFMAMDESMQEEYMSKILSGGGIKKA